jgi:hypothetical protein
LEASRIPEDRLQGVLSSTAQLRLWFSTREDWPKSFSPGPVCGGGSNEEINAIIQPPNRKAPLKHGKNPRTWNARHFGKVQDI